MTLNEMLMFTFSKLSLLDLVSWWLCPLERPIHKCLSRPKENPNEKRSSLFRPAVRGEEKKFDKTDARMEPMSVSAL